MIYLIILVHWIGDFVMQTDEMARGKSKSWKWLTFHILSYVIPLNLAAMFFPDPRKAVLWVFFNGVVHFGIDAISSRITSKLWAKNDVHNFFVVVGADQALHMATLIWSYNHFIAG